MLSFLFVQEEELFLKKSSFEEFNHRQTTLC